MPDLATLIGHTDAHAKRRRLPRLAIAAALILAAIAAALIWRQRAAAAHAGPAYVTEPLRRGDIHLDITATGNLEPTNEVTVGSELSGIILEVYVDTNDHVTKGQPLAKLDTSKLAQQTEAARATLAANQARVAQAEATLREARATLARQQELQRLSSGKLPSRADLDAAVAAADRAAADLLSAQAAVLETQAQLSINETDLAKAVIKSPIDGIILTRAIEPGQTVAASFTAPELFVIAEKLEHMKLNVAIAEADIGRVAAGQRATFAVDAWPGRAYTAAVLKVSYGSSITDNVVTYETELEVANDDLTLRPGMTATADIRVAESKNTFLVPAAALRFTPPSANAAPVAVSADGNNQKKSIVDSLMPRPPRSVRRPSADEPEAKPADTHGTATIWILRDARPEPLAVSTGLSDGRRTEIRSDALAEGLPVIIRTM
ncbi:efflux RND transporter periplasmic adaptor subunit [Termitidicoccus mucosus]|uniref:Efflux transporter periplasmic adaptor subunit n=1 Tax=Termitidicoccus mucosus TaxID=1184151 RepID=A0A178IMW8_9BACT|nr:efflux transporter periplasmic adaptor subunit [Opitutaceae bacterium TSB47]